MRKQDGWCRLTQGGSWMFWHALVLEALNFFSMLKMVQVCNQLDCNPRAQQYWCDKSCMQHAVYLKDDMLSNAAYGQGMSWHGMIWDVQDSFIIIYLYYIGRHLLGIFGCLFLATFGLCCLRKGPKLQKSVVSCKLPSQDPAHEPESSATIRTYLCFLYIFLCSQFSSRGINTDTTNTDELWQLFDFGESGYIDQDEFAIGIWSDCGQSRNHGPLPPASPWCSFRHFLTPLRHA